MNLIVIVSKLYYLASTGSWIFKLYVCFKQKLLIFYGNFLVSTHFTTNKLSGSRLFLFNIIDKKSLALLHLVKTSHRQMLVYYIYSSLSIICVIVNFY